jgi:hypothetical protein
MVEGGFEHMTGTMRMVVVTAVVGFLASSCKRSSQCPEGMSEAGPRSEGGKSLWCKSKDGKLARFIQFHGPNDRRQSCGYNAGKPEGSYTAWHPGGKPWIEGEYRDGRKSGRWTQWDKLGAKVAEGEYRDGQFVAGAPVGIPATCETMKP